MGDGMQAPRVRGHWQPLAATIGARWLIERREGPPGGPAVAGAAEDLIVRQPGRRKEQLQEEEEHEEGRASGPDGQRAPQEAASGRWAIPSGLDIQLFSCWGKTGLGKAGLGLDKQQSRKRE